jgi:hypothetical protein
VDFLTGALAAADGADMDIVLTLCLDSSEITGEGFTFTLDAATVTLLEDSGLVEYGFYDAEGNLQDMSSVTLSEAGTVVFAVKQNSSLIPEPTTTSLSLLALSALCMRRRRQK